MAIGRRASVYTVLVSRRRSKLRKHGSRTPFRLRVLHAFFGRNQFANVGDFKDHYDGTLFFSRHGLFQFEVKIKRELVRLANFLGATVRVFPIRFQAKMITSAKEEKKLRQIRVKVRVCLEQHEERVLFGDEGVKRILHIRVSEESDVRLTR